MLCPRFLLPSWPAGCLAMTYFRSAMERARALNFIPGVVLASLVVASAQGEVVFLDAFNTASGSIANSKPWIDVQGLGWKGNPGIGDLQSDGLGHLFSTAQSGDGVAGVPLTPIGAHGSLTLSATVKLPIDPLDWIGLGFADQ